MCSDVVVPEENGRKINFSIKFETVELPFAESIGTSLELEKRPDRELWSNDMLIPFDEKICVVNIHSLMYITVQCIITGMYLMTNSTYSKSNNCIRKKC